MDFSRTVKRLLIIFAISLIVIYISKSLLSKAAKNVDIERQKKQASTLQKNPPATETDALLPTSSSVGTSEDIKSPAENFKTPAKNTAILATSSPVDTHY